MIKTYFCHYELINNDVTVELGKPEKIHIDQSHNTRGKFASLTGIRG